MEEIYQALKDAVVGQDDVFRIDNPLNQKQPLGELVFRHTQKGWIPYKDFQTNCETFLSQQGIEKSNEQQRLISRLSRDITVEMSAVNRDSQFLIRTKDGEIIDIEALNKIVKAGKDPACFHNEWKKPPSEFKDRKIIFSMGVNYDPAYTDKISPFLMFLKSTFGYDVTINWVLKFFAMSLLQGKIDRTFLLLLGKQKSGKTTLVNLIAEIFGATNNEEDGYSYFGTLNREELFGKEDESVTKALFKLNDRRLVSFSEPNRRDKINTSTLKKLTGKSLFKVNSLSFNFNPIIIIDSNFPITLDVGTDDAFDDRLVVIPMYHNDRTFIDGFICEMRKNKDAIFSFLVHNAAEHFDSTIDRPNFGTLNVSEYVKVCIKRIQNPAWAFYQDTCNKVQMDDVISAGELYKGFQEYVEKILKEGLLKQETYLDPVLLEIPTLNNFIEELRQDHTYHRRTSDGVVFENIFFKRDFSPWQGRLDFRYNTPEIKQQEQFLKETDEAVKKIDTLHTPEEYQQDLADGIKDNTDVIKDRFISNPGDVHQAIFPFNPVQSPMFPPPMFPPPPTGTPPPTAPVDSSFNFTPESSKKSIYQEGSGYGVTPFNIKGDEKTIPIPGNPVTPDDLLKR